MDMIRTVGLASSIMEATPETSFIESLCLPIVREAQNADGGWGFHVGSQSRVEPTCWALQALMDSSCPEVPQGADRGFQFLRAAQLADGSWPFFFRGKSWLLGDFACLLGAPQKKGLVKGCRCRP